MEKERISERLRGIVNNISSIPTLPVIASRVMELIRNPRTPIQEIASTISSDQSLTSAVLKVVNSAYYGFPRQISTVKHALVILGFNEIKNIVFTISILRSFPPKKNSPFFNHQAFWQHSLGCALASKMLARFFRYRVTGKVFVAGLLHDIGKVFLNQYARDLFEKVMQRVLSNNTSFYEAEKNVLGVTHAEIGGWLAYRWNLPQEIEESIKVHHFPARAKLNQGLCCVVHLADFLVKMKKVGWSGDKEIPRVDTSIWKMLQSVRPDVDETYLEYFAFLLEEEINQAKPFFDIIG